MSKVAQPASFWRCHAHEILGVALLVLTVHDVFGAHGFLAMRQTQKEIAQLRTDITRLNEENAALAGQVKSLKTDPKTIERFARDMGMAKPGEIIFKLPPAAAAPQASPSNPSKQP